MTNEEALNILHCPDTVGGIYGEKYGEALSMAMEALEQEPCEDAISREDALMALTGEWSESRDELIPKAIKRIKKLSPVTPARPKSEWIPVSEKLPEDGTWVIFTDGSKISVERYKVDIIDHFFPQERWFSFDDAVAWMPLPEPYKADKAGDESEKSF